MDINELSLSSEDDEPFDERGPVFVYNRRRNRLLGLLGCGLMLIGFYLPIFSIPTVSDLNYLRRPDGILVFIMAIFTGLAALVNPSNLVRGLPLLGTTALATMCFTLCHFFARIGGPRDEIAQTSLSVTQIRWGWIPLLSGGFLILAAGLLPEEERDWKGNIIPVSDRRAWVTLAVAGALMAGTVIVAYLSAPDFLRNLYLPGAEYDRPARSGRPADSSRPSGWRYSEAASELDGKKTGFLSLAADESIVFREVIATLYIRCQNGKAELYINTKLMVDSDIKSNTCKVLVKFDKQQTVAQRWDVSTDHQTLFAPDASQLIKQLSTTQLFLFEFTLYDKSMQAVRFYVDGLDTHLGKIAEVCPEAKLQ